MHRDDTPPRRADKSQRLHTDEAERMLAERYYLLEEIAAELVGRE